jgi:nitroimidazol reductase NimA-like FMN-containing flavoprotein (pyridoxamine 5'-phosphate oxidase superfamily)
MAETPIRLDEITRATVASGRLVHLATINEDGTPQVTCIYVGWDGDDIGFFGFQRGVTPGSRAQLGLPA